MEAAAMAFGIMGFGLGAICLIRLEKLTKELKNNKTLAEDYKSE